MTTELEKLNFITKVISSFRVSIPPALRDVLDLKEGDVVELEIIRVVQKKEEAATA